MITISGHKTYAKTRKNIRYKLARYPKLKKLAINLHSKYCNLTGPLHILPDFYIVGFAKCGTTSLFEYLMQHPDVLHSVGKEIDYFGEYYSRGVNWYKVCFPLKLQKVMAEKANGRKCITGEATPRYIDHPHAPFRIKKITPNAKFIVLLRNPIDRAFSNYTMNVNSSLESERETLSFEKALEKEKERTKNEYEKMQKNKGCFSWNYYLYAYLAQGIYIDKIKIWTEIFPRKQLLILQSEKFFHDPAKKYLKVLDFLGIPEWNPKEFKIFKSGKYQEKNIDPKLRKKLSEFFRPHNEKLYEFLGERFDWDE